MWSQSTKKILQNTTKYMFRLLSLKKTEGNSIEGSLRDFHAASNF